MTDTTSSVKLVGSAVGKPHSNARRATMAAFFGSTLEYYDLFIYGAAAALVFPKLFFAPDDNAAGVVASFATFAAAYVLRPVSAIVWGHLGDRVGRKSILVLTLVLMGLATLIIGLLPTYQQVGIWAPVLLVFFRLLQGFSAGGESAGSSTLTIEHAPENRRGFLASFTMAGCMTGTVLANLVFAAVALLPNDQLMSWGWRIPFLLSALLLFVAFAVRRTVEETPVFEEEVNRGQRQEIPLIELFRTQWVSVLQAFAGTFFAMIQILFLVFGLYFAKSAHVGVSADKMLLIQGIATAVCAVLTPAWALLSDKIGRRPVWILSAISSAAMIFVYFWAISTGNLTAIFFAAVVMFGVAYAGMNGVWPAFMSEQFAAPVRFSGLAIGVQAGLLVAGFAPSISFVLAGPQLNWVPVAIFGAGCALIAGLGMGTARETFRVKTRDLGLH